MKIGDPGTSDLGQKGFAALPEVVGPTGGIWIGMLHSDGIKKRSSGLDLHDDRYNITSIRN